MSSPPVSGAKRPREEVDVAAQTKSSASAVTTAAPPPAAPAKQYIEERDENTKIVKNSPYNTQRSSFGWGTPFQPAQKCTIDEFPNIHIGISSLNGVPGKDRAMPSLMSQYMKKFACLEHCYPYHRMCAPDVWEHWRSMVNKKPFVFTIKANQFLTHTKMLDMDEDVATHIENFFVDRCPRLAEHLGPVLVQLPPQFRCSPSHMERIKVVASRIPKSINVAVEFRHKSWFCSEVYELLRAVNWGLVVTHNEDIGESPFVITNPKLLYVRLHGAVSRFVGDYGPVLMQRWAEVVAKFVLEDRSRHVYFFLNNNESQIGGLTSSVVDATCLAAHLKRLLKEHKDHGALRDIQGDVSVMGGLEMEPSTAPERAETNSDDVEVKS